MSLPDTDTVPHHCKIAGRADTLFPDDAIALIHNASRRRDDCHIRPVREVFKIGFLGDLDYGDGLVVRCQLLNDPRSGRQPGQVRNQQLPVGAGYRAIPRPRMRDHNFTRHRGCLGPCAADTVAVRDNVNIDAVGDLIVVTD